MSGFAIDCHRLIVLALVALLSLSLVFPISLAAAGPLTDLNGVTGVDRQLSADAGDIERSESARIDPTLEDVDGVVEVIVRLERSETATVSTDEVDPLTLQTAANRSQEPLERAASETEGLEVEQRFWLANAALVGVDTDRVDLERVAEIDGVVGIQADSKVELSTTTVASGSTDSATAGPGGSSEPKFDSVEPTSPTIEPSDSSPATTTQFGESYTYGLEQLSVPTIREEYDARGEGARVAVLDTGVDDSHPDIRVDEWRDFSGTHSSPVDYNDHGTHVAGSVVGGDASGTEIGVAPEADLLAGAVLTECDDDSCVGHTSDVIAGMEWAVDNDADVISLSLGSEGYSEMYIDAVRNAEASGTVVVAGAGNSGEGVSASPGNVYDVISVGATDEYERVADFSSSERIDTDDAWGWDAPRDWPGSYTVPTVVAPGDRIYSATPGGGYEYKRGTSMATPHVAGVIALLQGATEQQLRPAEIDEVLTETARTPGGESSWSDDRYGHGLVDAAAAFEEATSYATLEGTVTDTVTDEPISGATIIVEGPDGAMLETTTGHDGQYALEGITGDREYTITVAASGYETASEERFVPADETTTHDVSLAGDEELEVILEDKQFGDGIADADVTASDWGSEYPGSHEGDGVYVVENLPGNSEYTVAAAADGYVTEETQVVVPAGGETVTERLALSGDGTLEVNVADAVTDAAIENAALSVERPDGNSFEVGDSTADDGTLAVTVPGTGDEYTVTAEAEGYESGSATETVSSGETVDVDLPLAGNGELEVVLEDGQFGDGVTDADVVADGEQGTYTATHEGDGVYRLERVPSLGEYTMNATAVGYVDESVSMTIDSDVVSSQKVVLEGDATLSIAVDDEDGEPIGDASLVIERPDGASFAAGETGSDGRLEVTVPGIGLEYTVVADAEGYESNSTTTEAVGSEATESVTVTLSEAGGDGVPGFGAVAGLVAVLGVLAVSVARQRT